MIKPKKLTKRQLQAIETRKKLFQTATELFMEHGYETVTVDEIVERAGTSKGAFYTHFKSKDQIILEQFEDIDDYYLETYERIKKLKRAKNQLLAFIKAQHYYVAEVTGISFIKTVYYSQIVNTNGDKPFNDENRPLHIIVQKIIEQGQENGEFRKDVPSIELTRMITRCMRGTIYDWCVRNGEFDIQENGHKFFRLIVDSMRVIKK